MPEDTKTSHKLNLTDFGIDDELLRFGATCSRRAAGKACGAERGEGCSGAVRVPQPAVDVALCCPNNCPCRVWQTVVTDELRFPTQPGRRPLRVRHLRMKLEKYNMPAVYTAQVCCMCQKNMFPHARAPMPRLHPCALHA